MYFNSILIYSTLYQVPSKSSTVYQVQNDDHFYTNIEQGPQEELYCNVGSGSSTLNNTDRDHHKEV